MHYYNLEQYFTVCIVLGSAVSFHSLLNTVHVLLSTKPGSKVTNLTLLIDEAALNSSYYLIISKYNDEVVYHNNSGRSIIHYSHNIEPLFELTSSTPDLVSSNDTLISHLRLASPVQECVTADSTRYVAVSFSLHLLSDSLYHLGNHLIVIRADFKNRSSTNAYISYQLFGWPWKQV